MIDVAVNEADMPVINSSRTSPMKSFALAALLALAGLSANAATVDPGTAISRTTLHTWPSGYNVSYTLDFGGLLGAGQTLNNWTLTAQAAPGAFFSTAWVNGSGDSSVCGWNAPLSIGVTKRAATFTSGCAATAGHSFTFFLQGQGRFDSPTFSLASDALVPPPAAPIAATPLPAAGWMLIAAIGGLLGLSRRRRAA